MWSSMARMGPGLDKTEPMTQRWSQSSRGIMGKKEKSHCVCPGLALVPYTSWTLCCPCLLLQEATGLLCNTWPVFLCAGPWPSHSLVSPRVLSCPGA